MRHLLAELVRVDPECLWPLQPVRPEWMILLSLSSAIEMSVDGLSTSISQELFLQGLRAVDAISKSRERFLDMVRFHRSAFFH